MGGVTSNPISNGKVGFNIIGSEIKIDSVEIRYFRD